MIQKKIKAVLIFLGISVCLSIPSSFLVGIILPVTVEQVKTKSLRHGRRPTLSDQE